MGAKKMAEKKRNRAHRIGQRKKFSVFLSYPAYLALCEMAGATSLSDTIETLIQAVAERVKNDKSPTPRTR